MAKRVAVSTLNASTIDILNVIRQNASLEYQSLVPEVTNEHNIPAVGEVLYGYPALANQFINALVNRIALVRVKSATYNNKFAPLKKGYLEYGETVEEVFVNIAKAREFSVEKAESREFKRSLPDVRSAFHAMNWRVQYPITIQDEDLRTAFLSADGVTDLISRIVDSVYTAAEYDEYLLFKYLLIKAVARGEMYPVSIGTAGDMTDAAVKFRSMSNQLEFMNTKYNNSGVHTVTARNDQIIFMDAEYNAQFDVNVLASAFNMDKTTFMGQLQLVDDWTTFDNDRFDVIRQNCDAIEEVTEAELTLMKGVKAVMVDKEWFQIYDNNAKFTEDYVASGMYWNYFYNVWKTVSSSPFSNAVVFALDDKINTGKNTRITVYGYVTTDNLFNYVLGVTSINGISSDADSGLIGTNRPISFIQTEDMTKAGIAVQPYGAFIIPHDVSINSTDLLPYATAVDKLGNTYKGRIKRVQNDYDYDNNSESTSLHDIDMASLPNTQSFEIVLDPTE